MTTQAVKAADIQRLGISKPYAHQIARGHSPSLDMALRIWRGMGVKLGPLAGLSDEEVAVAEKVNG